MNRKFLDELYRKLSIISAEIEGLIKIKDFDGRESAAQHQGRIASIVLQKAMLNEIIDDYLAMHSKPAP